MARSPIQPKKQDDRMSNGGGVGSDRERGAEGGQNWKKGVVGNKGGVRTSLPTMIICVGDILFLHELIFVGTFTSFYYCLYFFWHLNC